MRASIAGISADLNKAAAAMCEGELKIDFVAYIGKTEPLGRYFADFFGCDMVNLPSAQRKGAKPRVAKALNSVYPYFPEPALMVLSRFYRALYSSSERVLPSSATLNGLTERNGRLTVVLVDDNTYTGKTMEIWKERLKILRPDTDIVTFAVTATGKYRPDYYCFEAWRSFEWRAIGI